MSEPDLQAVNRDFIRYEQVEKSHTYRLAKSDCEFEDDYAVESPLNGDNEKEVE